MKKLFTNKKGFSMIELMVVVAIIGVLAAIGIPQYSKFQAKARQSEAKLSLAALFTAEESFRQEWNQFSVTLNNIGFSVQGSRLRYLTGFASGAGCTNYSTTNGAPTEVTTNASTWSDGANVNTNSATWTSGIAGMYPTGAGTTCTNTTFIGAAYGSPASSVAGLTATNGDTWTVNQVKLISNTQVFLGN
ncbi:MAG: type IV pilin protein [Pseudobdellovibrio sp.]